MKIAMPIAGDKLCLHFGHCEKFYFFDVDEQTREISSVETMVPPPHEPGLLPRLLHEKGVNLVLASGMGARAQQLFAQKGIRVVTGADPGASPEDIVKMHLAGTLKTGSNPCDH
jgi:ATP-binding protein involved in chromosome partitioning